MNIALTVKQTLRLLALILGSFAFANAIVFFVLVWVAPSGIPALPCSGCDVSNDNLLLGLWGIYRMHMVVVVLFVAMLLFVAPSIKKLASWKELLYTTSLWLAVIAFVTLFTGRDFYIQIANPPLSSRQLAWIAAQWLIAALILSAGNRALLNRKK